MLTGLLVVAPLVYWAVCAVPVARARRMLWAFALLDNRYWESRVLAQERTAEVTKSAKRHTAVR